MVKINRRIAWYVLCTVTLAEGRVGCMSNERPVYKYDNKALHAVPCDCPCTTMLPEDRNRCPDCGHYHFVRPLIIVDTQEQWAMAERAGRPTIGPKFGDPVKAIRQLIAAERSTPKDAEGES